MKIEAITKRFDTDTILNEISDTSLHQKDIATTYAAMIYWSQPPDKLQFDVAKINKAIIERWSINGLRRIKEMAWDWSCFD